MDVKQETRVTVKDAKAAALRLINSHFRKTDRECARVHIPAREDDDDLLLMRFLNQQEVGESSSKGHAELPAFPIEKLKAFCVEQREATCLNAYNLGNSHQNRTMSEGAMHMIRQVITKIEELEAEENIGGGGKDA